MKSRKGKPPGGVLSDADVLKQVRELAARDAIKWRPHAELQMAKRGWTRGQVTECLRKGTFTEQPYVPNRAGPVQYEFAMRARIDGVPLNIAASLVPESHVVVITAKNRRE